MELPSYSHVFQQTVQNIGLDIIVVHLACETSSVYP